MRKVIGSDICVYLKRGNGDVSSMSGILVDITEDCAYVQGAEVYIIPRSNISYCTTDRLPSSDRVINGTSECLCDETNDVPCALSVFINDSFLTHIPVHANFDLSQWHDNIMGLLLSNQQVIEALKGKVQKELRYAPGEVYITVDDSKDHVQNTFVLDGMGLNPCTQFVNPIDMVNRLQGVSNGGKKDGKSKS